MTSKRRKMASVRVIYRDCSESKKTLRFPIELNQGNGNTDVLYSAIAKHTGSSENDFEIVYLGQRVGKGISLDALNLTPQSTLFAFRNQPPVQPTKDINDWHRVSTMIHQAVKHPNYRKIVEQLLNSQNSLQKLIAAVPGLDQDPIVMSMLQDPELLSILAHRQNIFKVLQQHPLLGPAATYIAGEVNKNQPDLVRPSRSNVYSLDQMSDDEDDGQQAGAVGGASPHLVTASQLAAALAAATAGSSAGVRLSTSASSSAGPSQSASGTGLITSDFFQQAMMSAQSSALDAQLQQLRDMGITDENVARQALQATNGDLQAALDMIFGN